MTAASRNPEQSFFAGATNVSRETFPAALQGSREELVRTACVLEVTARKPGNVHPEADPAVYDDFLKSADAVAPVLAQAAARGIGPTVLDAVRATRRVVDHNTNLGIVLLLAPLAAVPHGVPLEAGIEAVLARTTRDDARDVYEAIRLADPGGLGSVPREDVAEPPSCTLLEAMRLAADRDLVARQYANGFREVLGDGVPRLRELWSRPSEWECAVLDLHLHLMSRYPDSLIARKCEATVANESACRAAAVLKAGGPTTNLGTQRLAQLDAWLRGDGNRRNPGTTADLVAASLFAFLRDVGEHH